MNSEHDRILSTWFKGAARTKAEAAMSLLEQSQAQGYWVAGASRKCRAAFMKTTGRTLLAGVDNYNFHLEMALKYAGVTVDRVTMADLDLITSDGVRMRVAQFIADMKLLNAEMARLDAVRPKPVITEMGVSPTTTATLEQLGIKPATVRLCPTEWEMGTDSAGNPCFFVRLKWPEGTKHGASRFHHTTHNRQCQACGHAIKDAYNWVPLVMENAEGPISMWVGRDCAKKLFGIRVSGDLMIANDDRAA